MKDYLEDEEVEYCAECGQVISDTLEAYHHVFIIRGAPLFFHKDCCPIVLEKEECKTEHL